MTEQEKRIEKECFKSCKARLKTIGIKIMYQGYFDLKGRKRKRIVADNGGVFDNIDDLRNKISHLM